LLSKTEVLWLGTAEKIRCGDFVAGLLGGGGGGAGGAGGGHLEVWCQGDLEIETTGQGRISANGGDGGDGGDSGNASPSHGRPGGAGGGGSGGSGGSVFVVYHGTGTNVVAGTDITADGGDAGSNGSPGTGGATGGVAGGGRPGEDGWVAVYQV